MTLRRAGASPANRTSRTATLAAAIRAHHWRWHHAPILADDYAVRMVSPFWHQRVHDAETLVCCRNRLLRERYR